MRETYVAALLDEIALAGERARLASGKRRRCRTIFLGGGTPSLLTARQIESIIAASAKAFALDSDAEITLEANPGTLEYGHLDEIRAAGANRLSMGAQSFDARLLRWMGRIHSPEEIVTALTSARAAGFENINLDFIYALPGQSMQTWADTLARAVDLGPDHLSLYSLIVEEGTPLRRWVDQGKVHPADDDVAADMYELAEDVLAHAGYEHYEISNWARTGHECAHNLTYWHNLPYIGLGAGAHGWFAGLRYAEARPIGQYLRMVRDTLRGAGSQDGKPLPAAAVVENDRLDREDEMAETAMLGMRLVRGIELRTFRERFGEDFHAAFDERLASVMPFGLIEEHDGHIRLTRRGRLLGNEVFASLLP